MSLTGCFQSPGLTVGSPPASFHDQSLTWVKEITHESTTISLGYGSGAEFEEGAVEPVAMITSGNSFTADAMVFHQLIDVTTDAPLTDEAATQYENDPGEIAGLYKLSVHQRPSGVAATGIRFRIILPRHADPIVETVALPK